MSGFIKTKQLNSGNETIGKTLLTDGNGGFTYDYIIPKGSQFPTSPLSGDTFYRTDINEIFIYDESRLKWLSIDRNSLECSRSIVENTISGYMYVGESPQSSTNGFRMPYNGTIVGITINNSNILTSNRTLDVRINNSESNRIQITINNGNSGATLTNCNLDFSTNDLIQCLALSGTNTLNNVIVKIEIARRV